MSAEGNLNIAIGNVAMNSATTASRNIAIGEGAMNIMQAGDNIALGNEAMAASATGEANIAIGTFALRSTGGAENIAIGLQTMGQSFVGEGNIAIGSATLQNCQGDINIAIGNGALGGSIFVNGNIAIGDGAMPLAAGDNNIAIGNAAGAASPAGIDNIWIGSLGLPEVGTIGIGTPGVHVQCFIQGIANITLPDSEIVAIFPDGQLGVFVPVPSSERFKHNIIDMGIDSELIYNLRPVTFEYNDDPLVKKSLLGKKQYGLIAEEVNEILPTLVKYHQDEIFSVEYEMLSPLLLNEVQKINKKVTTLEEEVLTIADLKADNQKMKKIINNLLARIKKLEERMS